MTKVCEHCRWLNCDWTVGDSDCESPDIGEEDLRKYYSDGEEGCPFFKPLPEIEIM